MNKIVASKGADVDDPKALLGTEQPVQSGFVDLALHGVQVVQDAHAVIGIGGGDIEHPILGFRRGDDYFVGPRNDLGGIDGSFSEATDEVFSHGAGIRCVFHKE